MQRLARLALIGLTVVLAPPLRAQAPGVCKKADDTTSGIIAELRDWVTTTDPERMMERDSIFKVPVVNVKEISVVTNERICRRASEGYSKLSGGTRPASLYVIRIGPNYFAVYDPLDKAGDMMTVHIMNRQFVSIGGWTGP
jgi:hypothetical protein